MCMGCGVSGRAGTNLGNIIVRRAGEPLEMLSYAIIVFFFLIEKFLLLSLCTLGLYQLVLESSI